MGDEQTFLAGMEENHKLQAADHIELTATHFSPIHQHPFTQHNQYYLPESSENFTIHQEKSTDLLSLSHAHTQSCKRKALHMSSSANSSPQVSDNGKNISVEKGKKLKRNEKKLEGEIAHVRAKRGQATDSHSLAERVRREKINERLRCLQDIVPGCYKTMGMAVMLDEIINYVQSLQNQVEFLSMKLTAASTFYDFNAEAADALEAMQRAKAFEASNIQHGVSHGLHSPQFPHNR